MRRCILAVLVCILLIPCGALAEENLLQNAGFEEVEGGLPAGWTRDMWIWDEGVSYMEVREGGRDGSLCAMIENVASNDARFLQTVAVEPNTCYHISGWVKAEDCDTEFAGASISIIDMYTTLPEVHDTAGEWVHLECWVLTSDSQTSLMIGPRLGNYSSDNTGKAYFDDLHFAKAEDVAPDAVVIPLMHYNNSAQQEEKAPAQVSDKGSDLRLVMVLGFAALLALLWGLRMRNVSFGRAAIWVVLAAAALVRLYLMATQPGYTTDMNCFNAWSREMFANGPANFYQMTSFCDYPPGYMYFLWINGAIMHLFGLDGMHPIVTRVLVKGFPVLADLAAVYLIWRLARKRLGEMPALLLSMLYAFSPAILVDSAMWGQIDAVLALGLLVTIMLVMEDNWLAALPVFAVTVLMKPQALMAAPIGVMALAMDMIPWKEKGKKVAVSAGIGLGISVVVLGVLLLPFLINQPDPMRWLIDLYSKTLGSYAYATLSATNFYYLIGDNWVPLDSFVGPFTYGTWGTIVMAVLVVLLMVLYALRKKKELLPFFCAMIYIVLFMFGVKMHERYLFPALLLLLYAYIRKPDRRVLVMFIGFSVTFFLNCAQVLLDTHMPLGFDLWGMLLSAVNIALTGIGIWVLISEKEQPLPPPPEPLPKKDHLPALEGKSKPIAKMRRKDWIVMLSLTLVYAAIAYIGLGSTVAPQTEWRSTGRETEEIIFDLGEHQAFHMLYYGGVNSRDHVLAFSFSDDGETWEYEMDQKVTAGDCFRWQYAKSPVYDDDGTTISWRDEAAFCEGRYVRLALQGPSVTIMEIVFRDLEGNVLPVASVSSTGMHAENAYDPMLLVDESDTVPEQPSYLNGTYFDEIYHARTGYEHAHAMPTYEYTHPPLGKVFIMLGIQMFGMTAFGWRFMGALAGVLMVPAMYMLGKVLFRRTRYATLAAFLMAFDMMHLTQTRIATIDSYAVLFIILMYTCMFRYMQMSFFRDGWKTLIPLGLSGLFMGLGCASKWICMYAAVGLAVLFAWTMVKRTLEWRAGLAAGEEYAQRVSGYPRYLLGTLGACVGFFILIPFAIYYFSYIPHFASETDGLTWKRFWDTQQAIFTYHAGLVDDHAFQSPWYEWPLMLKPMYYYNGKPNIPEGMVSTIMCMGNPAVWWVGLAALLYVGWQWLRPLLRGERTQDHRLGMILIGFAAQYLPWVLVPRSTFIYHYFGSLPFVMLCIVYGFERLYQWRPREAQKIQIGYMALVGVLFVAFYPVATGVIVPTWWADAVNWLGFLKLPGWKHKGWLYY